MASWNLDPVGKSSFVGRGWKFISGDNVDVTAPFFFGVMMNNWTWWHQSADTSRDGRCDVTICQLEAAACNNLLDVMWSKSLDYDTSIIIVILMSMRKSRTHSGKAQDCSSRIRFSITKFLTPETIKTQDDMPWHEVLYQRSVPKSHLWLWPMMTMVMCYQMIKSRKEWAPFLGLSLPPRPSQVDPNPCITQISESKTYIVKAMKSRQDKIGIQPGIGRVWDRRSEEPCKLFVCRDLISLG